jgi:hypothetical protein
MSNADPKRSDWGGEPKGGLVDEVNSCTREWKAVHLMLRIYLTERNCPYNAILYVTPIIGRTSWTLYIYGPCCREIWSFVYPGEIWLLRVNKASYLPTTRPKIIYYTEITHTTTKHLFKLI